MWSPMMPKCLKTPWQHDAIVFLVQFAQRSNCSMMPVFLFTVKDLLSEVAKPLLTRKISDAIIGLYIFEYLVLELAKPFSASK